MFVERLLNHRLSDIKTETILTDVAEVYNLTSDLPQMRQAIGIWERKLINLRKVAKAA
jgi:hypothetical protein